MPCRAHNEQRARLHCLTLDFPGAPRRIRTSDLRIRSPALYPAELWAHNTFRPLGGMISHGPTTQMPDRHYIAKLDGVFKSELLHELFPLVSHRLRFPATCRVHVLLMELRYTSAHTGRTSAALIERFFVTKAMNYSIRRIEPRFNEVKIFYVLCFVPAKNRVGDVVG